MVANALGLNDSKYQYVIDALEADELRRQREERDEEDRRQVRKRNLKHFVTRHLRRSSTMGDGGRECTRHPHDTVWRIYSSFFTFLAYNARKKRYVCVCVF